jgi:hypothetical protein
MALLPSERSVVASCSRWGSEGGAHEGTLLGEGLHSGGEWRLGAHRGQWSAFLRLLADSPPLGAMGVGREKQRAGFAQEGGRLQKKRRPAASREVEGVRTVWASIEASGGLLR